VARGDALHLRSLLRPALFVPETIPITDLLRQLHQNRRELALVVDEYGGVVGLVTVEDVVDESTRFDGISATVAGLLLATMNAVPARGALVVIAGRRWTVLEMEGPRIRRVSVRPETGQSV
jgi:CBS domain containing-hemolysin-like protein